MNRLPTACSYLVAVACVLGLIGCSDSNDGHRSDAGIRSDAAPEVDAASDANVCVSSTAGACCSSTECSGTTPTCDTSTHACRACTGDGDCASAVCDLETGACVATDNVVYAAPAGSDTAACTIARAFEIAATPRDTIKLEPGAYTSSITVSTPTLTVHGFGATWNAPAGSHSLKLDNPQNAPEHHLRVVGVSFVDQTSGPTISCTSLPSVPARIELDRVSIDAADKAVYPRGCSGAISRSSIRSHYMDDTTFNPVIAAVMPLTIDRTVIDGGRGIAASSTDIVITNSVIANQGNAFAVNSLGEGSVGRFRVSFSTIINSHVSCNQLQLGNSVILNQSSGAPADTITGIDCAVTFTTVFPQTTSLPGDNNKLGVDPMLKDPAAGDYRLKPGSPAIDAADPAATTAIDFEGTPRPQGARSDMGAFELVP